MKPKPSLKDSLCYSESIYVSFNLSKHMPLHLWPPLGGIHTRIHELKWGKAKKCYNRQEIHTLQKTRMSYTLRILFKRFAFCIKKPTLLLTKTYSLQLVECM